MKRDFVELFKAPPAMYRPMPQWSWNGDLTEARIVEQLTQFAAQGCGGLFTHARPGHFNGYMSEQWLHLWAFALEQAARLNLEFHIYDEFMCPAGHAGGLVISEHPHLVAQELTLVPWAGLQKRPSGEVLSFFEIRSSGTVAPLTDSEARKASPQKPILALMLKPLDARAGYGGFPFPDLTRRESTAAFIASTHARYAARCGEHFSSQPRQGGTRFMFSDEPYLVGAGGLPMSHHLLKTFRQDHGYDLQEHLTELCFSQQASAEVRFDYWWTVNRLFNENFMQPMAAWCEAHDLLFTGHLMEHEWPSPRSHPSAMASLRYMHAPGTDLLGFQFEATTPEKNGIYLLNLMEIRSVKQQLGREWMLVETCGGGGYETAYDMFKPLEDLVLAFGFNVIDPHLSHQTLSGMRKYDWPQTLSDHSPWWAYYRPHAEHIARANAALSQGREHVRVLVLHPTTSAWLHYTAPVFQLEASASDKAFQHIRQSQIDVVLALYGQQVDFDLGDELIMEELGNVEDGKLSVGAQSYEAVVLPPAMENWTTSTLQLMTAYVETGGHIYALRPAPARVQGRHSEAPRALQAQYSEQWHVFETVDELVQALREAVPPRLSAPKGKPLPASLCWRRVDLGEQGLLFYFCNPWAATLETDVCLPGQALQALDTATGDMHAVPVQQEDNGLIAHLSLPPRAHALWLCDTQLRANVQPVQAAPTSKTPIPLELISAERRAPNLLMLDYCDVQAYGRTLQGVNTLHADSVNWRWQGFERNPWQQAHQFKRSRIDEPMDPNSACQIRYHFFVDETVPQAARDTFRLGVERLWLYKAHLNGHPLATQDAPQWFDEDMRAVHIGDAVQSGENVLTLDATPFHILCEIMPIYLLGDFALAPAAHGFSVVPARPLDLGTWSQYGICFYPDAVRYLFRFALDTDAEDLHLCLGPWAGSVAAIALDDTDMGVVMHPPYTLALGKACVGAHTLAVDIVGNVKNMMGPHHAEGLPGSWTWAASPQVQPSGAEYGFCPCGLGLDGEAEAVALWTV